ncbi:MAG TPA: hypothetical protein VGC20_08955 [bacterium]
MKRIDLVIITVVLAAVVAVASLRTQIFYDRDGRETWRHEGFLDRPEIVAQFRRLGVE